MLKRNKKKKVPRKRKQAPTREPAVVNAIAAQIKAFSGPLPPPGTLAEYNEVLPGAADRILTMAESQSDHRQGLEKYVVIGDSRRSSWGIVAGLAVAALAFGIAGYFAYLGHPVEGTVVVGVNLGSIIGVFVYGTRSRREERSQRVNKLQ